MFLLKVCQGVPRCSLHQSERSVCMSFPQSVQCDRPDAACLLMLAASHQKEKGQVERINIPGHSSVIHFRQEPNKTHDDLLRLSPADMFVSSTLLKKLCLSHQWRMVVLGHRPADFIQQSNNLDVRERDKEQVQVGLLMCVCIWVLSTKLQISSHLRAHCHCNLPTITTTITQLFGDNSEGSGQGTLPLVQPFHRLSAGVNTGTLRLLTTHTPTHSQTNTETGLRAWE